MGIDHARDISWPPPADTNEVEVYEFKGDALELVHVAGDVAAARPNRSGAWARAWPHGRIFAAAMLVGLTLADPGRAQRSDDRSTLPARSIRGVIAAAPSLSQTAALTHTARASQDLVRPARGRLAERAPARPAFRAARPLDETAPRHLPAPFPVPSPLVVTMRVHIDERGGVTSAQVVSSTAAYAEAPLLRAARAWRYAAAERDGRPVASVRTVRLLIPR